MIGGTLGAGIGAAEHARRHGAEAAAWQKDRAAVPAENLAEFDLARKPKFFSPALLRRSLIGTAGVAVPAGLAIGLLNLKFHKKRQDKA